MGVLIKQSSCTFKPVTREREAGSPGSPARDTLNGSARKGNLVLPGLRAAAVPPRTFALFRGQFTYSQAVFWTFTCLGRQPGRAYVAGTSPATRRTRSGYVADRIPARL